MQSGSYNLKRENDIVEKAKTNDSAFDTLYNLYFNKIYSFIYKRAGNHERAEDIVSETFMKAFCNLEKYQSKGYPFSSWIYRIAVNCLIDHYRKHKRFVEINIDDAGQIADKQSVYEENLIKQNDKETVRMIIKKLKKRYQQVIYLKYFALLPNNEIGSIMGISANNAGVLLYRALQKFYKEYKAYDQKT